MPRPESGHGKSSFSTRPLPRRSIQLGLTPNPKILPHRNEPTRWGHKRYTVIDFGAQEGTLS
jgi:hypothetical protein